MSDLIFPNNPVLGQTYIAPGGKVWRYGGKGWIGLVDSGSQVYYNSTPPTDVAKYPLWMNTDTGDLMVFYQDVDSDQWIKIGTTGGGGGSGSGSGVVYLNDISDVDTSGVGIGQVIAWDGTNWTPASVSGAGPIGGLSDVDTTTAAPTLNDFLIWDSTNWIPYTLPSYIKADGSIPLTTNWDIGPFSITALTFISDVVTGTPPLTVASITKVINFNSDLLDDQDGLYYLDWTNFSNIPATLEYTTNKSVANGYASLDGSGKVPSAELPASAIGSVVYQGTWDANTNTPTLASGVGTQGYYYVVSADGSTNLDGVTDWKISDWVIYNGTVWEKVDNTDGVTSVAGKTGAVTLVSVDVGLGNVLNIKVNDSATTNPVVTDDSASGYAVLSRWANITTNKEFVCLDATVGAAIWIETTIVGGGSSIEVQDEGVPLTLAVTKFNFVGVGVTVTEPVTDEVLVTIPGGAGVSAIDDLSDVDTTTTTPIITDHLEWDGANWVPKAPPSGGAGTLTFRQSFLLMGA